jgi:hypothetical protein
MIEKKRPSIHPVEPPTAILNYVTAGDEVCKVDLGADPASRSDRSEER